MEGWNDPPQSRGPPTGNLKINLNKRVAFPLKASETTNTTSPLLLPPKPTSKNCEEQGSEENDGKSNEGEINLLKAKVLFVLDKCVKDIGSSSVQSVVSTKLKTLEDDWSQCDLETKKLLVELTDYLEVNDTKNAFPVQRKLVMKGCSKQWLHAIRQIIMNMENTNEQTDPSASSDPTISED